jgi:hypothetical protein
MFSRYDIKHFEQSILNTIQNVFIFFWDVLETFLEHVEKWTVWKHFTVIGFQSLLNLFNVLYQCLIFLWKHFLIYLHSKFSRSVQYVFVWPIRMAYTYVSVNISGLFQKHFMTFEIKFCNLYIKFLKHLIYRVY